MRVSILTIFPDFFGPALAEGMIRAAREKGRLEVEVVGLRDFTDDTHRTTDDYPFGGGPGMIMKVEPLDRALQSMALGDRDSRPSDARVVLLSPQGRPFTQQVAFEYAGLARLVLLCGRYKGVDERVREHLADEELSLGDFVLSGGEPAAIALLDACVRVLPGVIGAAESLAEESFERGLLEYPHYTRPQDWQGHAVPEALLTGHHEKVHAWRLARAEETTRQRRPDLWERYAKARGRQG